MKKTLRFKRVLSFALVGLLLGVVGIGKTFAYDFSAVCETGQTLYYTITDATNHHVSLVCPKTGLDGPWEGFTKPQGNIILPSTVNYNGIGYLVTGIETTAFLGCNGLTGSLLIPNSVTSIGYMAFANCNGFSGDLTIGNSVTSIGSYSFMGCSGFLGTLTIGKSVGYLNEFIFSGCSGFSKVCYNAVNCQDFPYDSYYGFPFENCGCSGTLIIGDEVERIPANMFRNAAFTGSLTIGNSVTSIGHGAFAGCSGFTGELIIPNSVTVIENGHTVYERGPFLNCTGFTSLVLGNSLEKTGILAFAGCSGLTSVTISNSVTTISNGTFRDCSSLVSINIPNSVTYVSIYAFLGTGWYEQQPDGLLYLDHWCMGYKGESPVGTLVLSENTRGIANSAFAGCSGLTGNLIIPNSVTVIGASAFSGCSGLSGSLSIPGSVSFIGDRAFYGCSGFSGDLIIPNSATLIGASAFSDCSGLTSVSIPSSVTSIGNEAFNHCSGLRMISYNVINGEDIDASIWNECPEITTIVIGDSVEMVDEGMFSGFENLTTVSIGKSVKTIGEKAFADNPRLNMVYYNVEKDLEASNNVFQNCPNFTTIHIGSDVEEIGSNVFKGCNTVHFVVAHGPTPAVLDAGAFSDIVDNSMLMVSCGNKLKYYSVWNMFPYNNIIEDCSTYTIDISVTDAGGDITISESEAQMGEEIHITINPNPGMVLVTLKVCNASDPTQIIPVSPAGKSASTYSFTMPPFGVVVIATFAAGTSVPEISHSNPVVVYPNPTSGKVKLEAEGLENVSIFNLIGQQLFNGSVHGDAFEYDFSGCDAGIYLIRIETAHGIATKQVVVAK